MSDAASLPTFGMPVSVDVNAHLAVQSIGADNRVANMQTCLTCYVIAYMDVMHMIT